MSNNNDSKIGNIDTSAITTTDTLSNSLSNSLYATKMILPITPYCDTDSLFASSSVRCLVNFMTEKEIDNMLDSIFLRLKRAKDEDNPDFKSVVSEIVRSRHFSEEFLMKYISYFSKSDALKYHSGDIQSGEYSQLGLYYDVAR